MSWVVVRMRWVIDVNYVDLCLAKREPSMQENNHRWELTTGTSMMFSIFSDIQTLQWQPTGEGVDTLHFRCREVGGPFSSPSLALPVI